MLGYNLSSIEEGYCCTYTETEILTDIRSLLWSELLNFKLNIIIALNSKMTKLKFRKAKSPPKVT